MAHNFQDNFNTILRPPMLQVEPQQQYNGGQFPPTGHIMPVPSSIPWSVQKMPWAQPEENLGAVMHFEARTNFLDDEARRSLLHVKRKSNPPTLEPPPKQFITEEKITAHFNGLHISNNFAQNQNTTSFSYMEDDSAMSSSTENCKTFANYQDYLVTAKELEEKLRNANRITLCDDLKKMQEEQKKTLSAIIPHALMNRIEKPCTALVLWKPPPILELLHRKHEEDLRKASERNNVPVISSQEINRQEDFIEDIEFSETDNDDFIDNNNNNFNGDMDEDL